MANKTELSLRFLPVEALIELSENDSRRKQVEKLAKLAATIQVPQKEQSQMVESRLPSLLEGKARIEQVTIGIKSGEELLLELRKRKANISAYAEDRVKSPEFTTLPELEQRELVVAGVGDLVPSPKGIYATTEEIWAARDQLGLQEVPAETALHYLLQNGDKLNNGDAIWMSMKTITGRHGNPRVFAVVRVSDGLWLSSRWAGPSNHWDPGSRFAFSLPQVATNA